MRMPSHVVGGAVVAAGALVMLSGSRWHDQFVDITARKPSGAAGRRLYRDPKSHYRSFDLLLGVLRLTPTDYFLDVCCGGGRLLERAMHTVARAAGLDHSPDMVAVTREVNSRATAESRLDARRGDAAALPWADESFTAVANANALFFLPDPVQVFREAHRVLKPGGRFAVATAARRKLVGALFGPWRSSMSLYSDDQLASMLRQAGFAGVRAGSPDGVHQIGYGVKE